MELYNIKLFLIYLLWISPRYKKIYEQNENENCFFRNKMNEMTFKAIGIFDSNNIKHFYHLVI